MIRWQETEFIRSAAGPAQFISDGLPKMVFAGRSNVGKSSTINKLLMRKNMARVGDTPGKTAHVNYFLIDKKVYFVDLPGYGYAKVSKTEKDRWDKLMEAYFARPDDITLGILIVDIRHRPTAQDIMMASYFQQTCKPFLVVANKADKLKKSQIAPQIEEIRRTLVLDDAVGCVVFSASAGQGREEVLRGIARYGEESV